MVRPVSVSRSDRPTGPARLAPRSPLRRARLALAALGLLALTSCAFGAPEGATEQGQAISHLWRVLWYFAIPVGLVVYGLILWSVFRYRRRPRDDGSLPTQTRYALRLEVTYTLIPVVLVAAIFAFTIRAENKVDRIDPHPYVVVDVDAFQWQWRFTYPESGVTVVGTPGNPPTLVLPAGETTRIVLRAEDVVHAFYVPQFLFQRQAISGVTNTFDLTIPNPGRWHGACSLYCGLDHTSMTFSVQAMSPGDFDRWLADHSATGTGA
jgi:cytochrome c oxidase subunit 2